MYVMPYNISVNTLVRILVFIYQVTSTVALLRMPAFFFYDLFNLFCLVFLLSINSYLFAFCRREKTDKAFNKLKNESEENKKKFKIKLKDRLGAFSFWRRKFANAGFLNWYLSFFYEKRTEKINRLN